MPVRTVPFHDPFGCSLIVDNSYGGELVASSLSLSLCYLLSFQDINAFNNTCNANIQFYIA